MGVILFPGWWLLSKGKNVQVFQGYGVKPQTFAMFAFHTDKFLVRLNWNFTKKNRTRTFTNIFFSKMKLENKNMLPKCIKSRTYLYYRQSPRQRLALSSYQEFVARVFLSILSRHGQFFLLCHILWAIRCIINRLNTPHIASKKNECKLHENLFRGQMYALRCTPLQ